MFGMSRSPVASYAQVSTDIAVETADPHRLILMLFDGARTAIWMARAHMERKEIAQKGAAISKAIDIIDNGLRASLDVKAGGELAERLASLYEYISRRLLWANLKNNLAALDEANQLLGELQSAWALIAPTPGSQAAA
ncbi:flagellar export chaperone FliS [Propionivibrio sp.]|uniref:flagellar export chaperone FliS n=1 Tax=Propionivibrio sp. TaxID=2212460 RepID=UPI003BEF5545